MRKFSLTSELLSFNQEGLARNLQQLIDDSKEIRETIELPAILYENDWSESENIDSLEENILDESLSQQELLLSKADEIQKKFQIDIISQELTSFLQELNINTLIEKYDFNIQQKNTSIIIKYDKYIIAIIHLLYNKNLVITGFQYQSTLIGNSTLPKLTHIPIVLKTLKKQLDINLTRAKDLAVSITNLLKNKQNALLLVTNNAYWKYSLSNFSHVWTIYNLADQIAFNIELVSYNFSIRTTLSTINTQNITDIQILKKINSQIQKTNYRTASENHTRANRMLLQEYLNDKKFLAKINILGLAVSITPRNDNDYVYFDIIETANLTKIGAYAVQKSNGAFWTMDKDDVPIVQSNIFEIAPAKQQHKLEEQNILLVGSHNKLADTIMIAHINKNKQVKIISIPRDIYYQGKKINWYFKRFSSSNFNKIISEITGLPISQYAYVDMYAFVSIIDMLGGITVFLQKDLIDPSYKIKENGVFTFLQYSQGEHFVSGIEALRIARSRYSTSDFNRSTRQHAILEGIKTKLNKVDQISSFISILKIMENIYPYIQTNITMFELAQMVYKYKNAYISNRVVLNTKNILYATYTTLYEKKLTESEVDIEELGQWILLPRNNDWNNLKLYIESVILE